MGVESVDDGHHADMASEQVATDLMMPAVRPSTGARPGSPPLLDPSSPWLADRPSSALAVDRMPGSSTMDGQPEAIGRDDARPPADAQARCHRGQAQPVDATARVTSDSRLPPADRAARRPVGGARCRRAASRGPRRAHGVGRRADRGCARRCRTTSARTLLYAGLLGDVGTIGPSADPAPDAARDRRAGLSRYRRDYDPAAPLPSAPGARGGGDPRPLRPRRRYRRGSR